MSLLITILSFGTGLFLLVAASNYFVNSAVRLAHRLRVPEMAVGATLVSLGTTLPELTFSAAAANHGYTAMAIGNAIGSITCNTAFIAALSIALRPCRVDAGAFRAGSARFFLAAAVFCLMAYVLGGIPRWGGLLLLAMGGLHIYSTLRGQKGKGAAPQADGPQRSLLVELLLLLVLAQLLYLGAHLLLQSGPVLARLLRVPDRVISLTFVALGTSLPELMTAVTALIKGHGTLSIGNILGANTLNLLLVLGASAAIAPLPSSSSLLRIDLPLMLGVMAVFCLPACCTKKLSRITGLLLLAGYAAYVMFLF